MAKRNIDADYWIEKLDDAKLALADALFNKDGVDFDNALSEARNACDFIEEFRPKDGTAKTAGAL